MSNRPDIEVSAGIVLQPFDERELDSVGTRIRDRVDEMLREIEQLQTEINLRTEVDTQPLENVQRILDSLDAEPVRVDVDDTNLRTAVGLHDDLNATTSTRTEVTDAGLGDAKKQHDDLNATTNTTTKVNSSEIETALGLLQDIKNLQAIQIGITVVSNIDEVVDQITNLPIIQAVNDQENALRTLTARTGESAEQYRQLIEDVYVNNWGESREEIASVIALSEQLGTSVDAQPLLDTGTAVQTAFEVAASTGTDVNDVLRAMNVAVTQGLTPNFRTAGDTIVAGFQNGANRGGDFLDTIIEYGSTFQELGLDFQETTNLLVSGLESGVMNTDLVADAVRELGIRLREAVGQAPADNEASAALTQLGLENPYETGGEVGAEFLNGMLAAIRDNPGTGMSQSQLLTALIGTQSEDIGGNILGLDAIYNRLGEIEGRATDAATAISGTLGGALSELYKTAESAFLSYLTQSEIDLDGKIQEITGKISEVADLIQEGMPLDQAIEIAFELPGFATGVDRLESIFGNFVIELGSAFANILEALGNAQAAEQVRESIEPLAVGQLTFDLALATNADDVTALVSTAMARGVDSPEVNTALLSAFARASADGNLPTMMAIADGVSALAEGTGDVAAIRQEISDLNIQLRDFALADPFAVMSEGDVAHVQAIREEIAGLEEQLATAELTQQFDLGLDPANLQPQIDATVASISQQYRDALAAQDFDTAGQILADMQATQPELASGFEVLMIDAFRSAIESGNFIDARAIAAQLNDPSITADFESAFSAYSAIAAEAFASGDWRQALDIANAIGDIDLAQQAFERLRDTVFQPSGGGLGGVGTGGGTGGVGTAGTLPTGTIFEQAVSGANAMEQAFTAKEPIISEKLGTLGINFGLLDETSAGNMTAISDNFAFMSGQLGTDAGEIDTRLQTIDTDMGAIKTTSENTLPEVNEVWGNFRDDFLETTDPIWERINAIIDGIEDVGIVTGNLPGVDLGGGSGATPSMDEGGWVTAGQPYMVNGELFFPPSDALALGLNNSSSLMSMVDWNAQPGTTNNHYTNTTVNVQQHLNAQSEAQASSAADRFADALRGY